MSTHEGGPLKPEPPQQYNFWGWDDFVDQALHYHNAVHPGEDQVIDRIATLRQFMSEPAKSQLGSFVRPHPRYRTTEGWDDWVRNATAALKSRDSTLRHATVLDHVSSFKKGKCSESELWEALDAQVADAKISSTEQRQLFWEAHSWEAQARLETRCPYFNPQHEVWSASQPSASERAEQKLAQLMELAKLDDQVAFHKNEFLLATVTVSTFFVALLCIVTSFAITRNSSFVFPFILTLFPTGLFLGMSVFRYLEFLKAQQLRNEFALDTAA